MTRSWHREWLVLGGVLLLIAWTLAIMGLLQFLRLPPDLLALALTIAIETPILWLMLRGQLEHPPDALLTGVLINAFTHPIVWHLLATHQVSWTVAELGAFATEAVLIRLMLRVAWPWAIGAALLANLITGVFGLWVPLP